MVSIEEWTLQGMSLRGSRAWSTYAHKTAKLKFDSPLLKNSLSTTLKECCKSYILQSVLIKSNKANFTVRKLHSHTTAPILYRWAPISPSHLTLGTRLDVVKASCPALGARGWETGLSRKISTSTIRELFSLFKVWYFTSILLIY